MTRRLPAFVFAAGLLTACSNKANEVEAAAEAEQIWQQRCVTCHGHDGSGNGPASKGLLVKPRTFQDPAWQASVDNERIKTVIVKGGAAVGLSEAMTPNIDLKDKPLVQDALVKKIRKLVK